MNAANLDDSELSIAPSSKHDLDWREKIAIAKREREAARRARRGKPITFTRPDIQPRGDRSDGQLQYPF